MGVEAAFSPESFDRLAYVAQVFAVRAFHDERFGDPVPVRGAIWTSLNGLVWERVPEGRLPDLADENVRLLGVTTGGQGLIAVGFRGEGDQLDAVVWASTEGETWQLATDQEGVLRSQGGREANT